MWTLASYLLSLITIGAENLISRWKMISFKPCIKRGSRRKSKSLTLLTTSTIDMVNTQEFKDGFSTTGTFRWRASIIFDNFFSKFSNPISCMNTFVFFCCWFRVPCRPVFLYLIRIFLFPISLLPLTFFRMIIFALTFSYSFIRHQSSLRINNASIYLNDELERE